MTGERVGLVAVAILLGAIAGVAGFLPLFWGFRLSRKATSTSNLGQMGALLLGVGCSFIVIVVAAILCIVVARDMALPFVLAEAIALSISAIVFGVKKHFGK